MCMPAMPVQIQQLLQQLARVAPYPPGVLQLPDAAAGRPLLPGIAFFPGGTGLRGADYLTPCSVFPVGKVMIIGQDFDAEAAYRETLSLMQQGPCDPCTRNPATWGRLLAFLNRFRIGPEACFFTNFFMGLRKGDQATGMFPGARDKSFEGRCREFMQLQLQAQEPRLVLTLGIQVPSRLAPLSPQLSHWVNVRNWTNLDLAGPVVHNVQFPGLRATCSVVALTHPSFRPPNVGRRCYGEWQGDEAEEAMTREALQRSGLAS